MRSFVSVCTTWSPLLRAALILEETERMGVSFVSISSPERSFRSSSGTAGRFDCQLQKAFLLSRGHNIIIRRIEQGANT